MFLFEQEGKKVGESLSSIVVCVICELCEWMVGGFVITLQDHVGF